MAKVALNLDKVRGKVDQVLAQAKHEHIASRLPLLTAGQLRTLAAHPETRVELMKAFQKALGVDDNEMFLEWLKKAGD